jgi:hypothetical protein
MGESKRRSRARQDWEASGRKLGDAPVEEQHYAPMVALIQAADELFNGKIGGPDRKIGIVMMVFPFEGFDGRCNYVSNGASREDIVILMKEMIARFEGQPEMTGRA